MYKQKDHHYNLKLQNVINVKFLKYYRYIYLKPFVVETGYKTDPIICDKSYKIDGILIFT